MPVNVKTWAIVGAVAVCTGALVAAYQWGTWVELPKLRAGVIAALKDPGSATWRAEQLKGGVVCGEVNARNSMGGYVGFKRYVSTPTRYALEEHGSKGWFAPDDHAATVRRIERATTSIRERGREPTLDEENKAEFDLVWSQNCAL